MSLAKNAIALASFVAVAMNVANAQTIDQQQPLINEAAGFVGIGGNSDQKLAQTFTVGRSGRLIALDLPFACGGATPTIELRRQSGGRPEGALLRVINPAPGDISPVYEGFQRLYFSSGVNVTSGDELAFTIRVEEGNCNYAASPAGDTYADGQGFFDSRPNPPGWLAFKAVPNVYDDLPFRTVMEDSVSASAGNCVVPHHNDPNTGEPIVLPITDDVPICRCFQDEAAFEFRCGGFHSDFLVLRSIPQKLYAGQKYTEKWEFIPLTELDGPVRMTIQGGGLYKPQ